MSNHGINIDGASANKTQFEFYEKVMDKLIDLLNLEVSNEVKIQSIDLLTSMVKNGCVYTTISNNVINWKKEE